VRVADTSFLFALFSSFDAFHDRAVRAAGRGDPILIPAEILSETLALVHYRQGFAAARVSGDWIRTRGHMEVGLPTRDLVEAAWRDYREAQGRISYPDAVATSWCRSLNAAPLAFDTQLLAYLRR
jgi:predicted nucleic acid-binding protein